MVLCAMFHIQWSQDECSSKISSVLMSSQYLLNNNHEASEETCFRCLATNLFCLFFYFFSATID